MIAAPALALGSAALAQSAPAVSAAKPVSRADFIKKIDAQFGALDANHDGVVTKAELQAAQTHAFQQRLQAEFRQLDTNHDGQLSFQEFAAAAHPNVTADQIVQKLDTNHDGKLSADEFRAPQLSTFAKLDANHDGVVTPAEVQAYARAHGSH
ncbi:MAG TPA: EF-hand domain-containing protein [Sphingomicrobium sp.]|jgi:Ca2+-binding EF-hand superfamily protein|nr:EF-hand domain-containing protein [Sphingomicrobium sp.]